MHLVHPQVVDTPPGTGDIHLSLAQTVALAGAVIVSTPQKVTGHSSIKAHEGTPCPPPPVWPCYTLASQLHVPAGGPGGRQEGSGHVPQDGGSCPG